MTRPFTVRFAAALAGALLSAAAPAFADNNRVVVIDERSAPADIGTMLFGQAPGTAPATTPYVPRTRGIQMMATTATELGAQAQQTQAAPQTAPPPPQQQQVAQPQQVEVAVPVNFAFNSSELDAKARATLDQVGKMLTMPQYASRRLVVEGHADAVGSGAYNMRLSRQRAEAAKRYLMQAHGIAGARLAVRAKGATEPLPGADPGDGVNRRVQFAPI